jgi:hypothetical protein
MKNKIIMLVLIISFAQFLHYGFLIAGTPHTAYGKVFNSDSSVPSDSEIIFSANITTRPGETLSETSTGCSYNSGYWNMQVGNFPTAWSVGETLQVNITNKINNETGSIKVVMTSAGNDAAEDLTLQFLVPVELSLFTVEITNDHVTLFWQTESEKNNLGFEIQRKKHKSEYEKIGFVKGYGTTTEFQNYQFLDSGVKSGLYYYRLKQIDFNGSYKLSNEKSVNVQQFQQYKLGNNYPNPFNPVTNIFFELPEADFVNLVIYDISGRHVKTLFQEKLESGFHSVTWNGTDENGSKMGSGIYLVKMIAGNFVDYRKMLLVK